MVVTPPNPHKDAVALEVYAALARDPVLPAHARILEVGVQSGESLRLWQELWPFAGSIVGVDIDPAATWPAGTVRVVADQADPELPELLAAAAGREPFDLVIDDASHQAFRSLATWSRLWPLVAPGGFYVWEDWGAGVVHPDHYGSPEHQLALMAGEVEARTASAMRVRPGIITLRKG